jgi:glycine cleavage system H protein
MRRRSWGTLVFVNLPAVGDAVRLNESFGRRGIREGGFREIISPFTGVVAEVNEELLDAPQGASTKRPMRRG